MAATVPGIEIADDADALGVRRPDGEGDAVDAIDLARVCAKPFKRAQMGAFGQQPNVDFTQHRREAVGIVGFLNAAGPDDAQAIAWWFGVAGGGLRRHLHLEQA